ncbi:MAG: TIGR03943 family protein [Actinomycetota bacterium]|nr:TIGR03943 family protein [Actinomycetota bacterium]
MKRHLQSFVLTAWAAFLIWLIATDEVLRYIGPKTMWVIWFGAIALSATAIAHFFIGRSQNAPGTPASAREAAGILILLVPILAVVVIPKPSLGAMGASRKLAGGISAAGGFVPVPDGGEVGFQEISFASTSAEYAATLGVAEGMEVELTGFVTHPDDAPASGFALTRFSIFCCAADATPYAVLVDPSAVSGGSEFTEDTWLRVRGALAKSGTRFVLVADEIETVAEPKDPYVY